MSHKSVAISFVLLLSLSTLPVAPASHIDSLLPDAPVLPHAEPTSDCIPVGVQAEILAKVNQLSRGDPAFYRDPLGVPSLCVAGQPVAQWAQAVRDLDALLEHTRNASREIQRQVDYRTEGTLPPSNYPNELVEPRTILLDDDFDGRRYTGFGDWEVVTERGEAPQFRVTQTQTPNGTVHAYRFGEDAGYARGVHQFLVSPEIDLTSLRQNKTAVQDLQALRERARGALWSVCNGLAPPGGGPPLGPVCGATARSQTENLPTFGLPVGFPPTPPLSLLVTAYEQAIDDTIYTLPVMQHGAYMDVRYRYNLDLGVDAVRVWLYAGDRQPGRAALFNDSLGSGATSFACAQDQAITLSPEQAYGILNNTRTEGSTQANVTCTQNLYGGLVLTNFPGMGLAQSLRSDRGDIPAIGFTGDSLDFVTARFNLTPFMDHRIWLLFEVKTQRNDRGIDIFGDHTRFPRQRDFGFELDRVYVEGDAYHRNLRVKTVGATYPYATALLGFGDANTTRTTVPPGNTPLTVWVHNAGDYRENATLRVEVQAKPPFSGAPFTSVGTNFTAISLVPDEVQAVRFAWSDLLSGAPLREGYLYNATATLILPRLQDLNGTTVGDNTRDLGNRTFGLPLVDPNTTRVQPENAAALPLGAGATTISGLIRSATVRNLSAVRADGALGNPLEICAVAEARKCASPSYAGRKGEPRTVLVGIRNDGNLPQDVTVILTPSLDGVAKPDIVSGAAAIELRDLAPNEIRPVTWTVVPVDPGAYDLVVSMIREGETAALDENAERRLFVQRSTGLICLDSIDERECGGYFESALVPELRDEDIHAAALGPDGTLYVATRMTESLGERHSGILAARDPTTRAWRVLANISPIRLNATLAASPVGDHAWGPINSIVLAPNDTIYLVGENRTLLSWRPTVGLKPIAFQELPTAPEGEPQPSAAIDLKTAIWYNGTLVVGGTDGRLLYLGKSGTMLNFEVKSPNASNVDVAYRGTIHALRVVDGRAVLVGEHGVILRHQAGANITQGWSSVSLEPGRPSAWTLNNATLFGMTVHGERLYIVGQDVFLASAQKAYFSLKRYPTPPVVNATAELRQVFASHDGAIYVRDFEGRLATCEDCASLWSTWTYPTLALPTVLTNGTRHLANVTLAVSDATRTILLGEAGLVAELGRAGTYENLGAWTTVPALAPRDNGVLQTKRDNTNSNTTNPQSLVIVPDPSTHGIASRATKFRLFLNHSVAAAAGPPASTVDRQPRINVLYRDFPNIRTSTTDNQAPAGICPPAKSTRSLNEQTICYNEAFRHQLARWDRPTPRDGWEFRAFDNIPPAGPIQNPLPASPIPPNAYFWGIELFAPNDIRWAIDDIRLEALTDNKWQTVAAFYGVGNRLGEFYEADAPYTAMHALAAIGGPRDQVEAARYAAGTDPLSPLNASRITWEEWYVPFDLDIVSPWHVTTQYADRPVFAANNEFYRPGWSNPTQPRILSNWDTRLVSPIIDLSDAYDPVIEFRHLYAFRTFTQESTSKVKAGDIGLIEVQYRLMGQECGSDDPTVTCGWSPFYVLPPEGGYPQLKDTGYAVGWQYDRQLSTDGHPYFGWRSGPGMSFWGRLEAAVPDERGLITAPTRTAEYETVRVRLTDEERSETLERTLCGVTELNAMAKGQIQDCLPVNVTGREIRVAFRLVSGGNPARANTADGHDWDRLNYTRAFAGTHPSSPGEGWYITDFKVLGARKLGIDLAVKDLDFRVGYDVARIGVGPATRVPINVTVENRGTFDALGYTGRLEVHEIEDPAARKTRVIETIRLPQQPVMDPGASRNHTLSWDVPAGEGKPYMLTFVVEPIGIDRDEDHLDNTAQLGGLSRPITAKTTRNYNVEFLVSPENATVDITRYVPIFINNTGNVPIEGITIERRITATGRVVADDARTCAEWRDRTRDGLRSAIVDCRVWTTDRPAPAGALTPLTALSGDVNPSSDLFWKAPERSTFLVTVGASARIGNALLTSGADRRVAAFATYFFDDVEGGPRGEAGSGNWNVGPGWNVSAPGFRSPESYAFGDARLNRYLADTDGALVTPTIELGSARTARIAFFHDYEFEAGFDAGIVEASADGGRTWSALTPISDPRTSVAYNLSFPVQAASRLHPSGDPQDVVHGFTSDSSLLPGNVDGWVLTQLDLTDYANVTKSDVVYEAYTSDEIERYDPPGGIPVIGEHIYGHASWCPGTSVGERCWEVQNLTQLIVAPSATVGPGPNTFWWSGSASASDDGVYPAANHLLEFDLDLSQITDEVVTAEWWEYAARYHALASYTEGSPNVGGPAPPIDQVVTSHTFAFPGFAGETYRLNLGNPTIVEQKGKWLRMSSDLRPVIRLLDQNDLPRTLKVGFAYTPLKQYGDLAANPDYFFEKRTLEDPGFAIDDFKVTATRLARGKPVGQPTVLLDETTAWDAKQRYDCGNGNSTIGAAPGSDSWATSFARVACLIDNTVFVRAPIRSDGPGRNWDLVTALPGRPSTWAPVDVRDHTETALGGRLPTGSSPHAWYSGDLLCREPTACAKPGSEARLVTPAFDLSKLAGDNAYLSFWHRFAFESTTHFRGGIPHAAGGVVEIQEFDAVRGEWGPWKQIYSDKNLSEGDRTKVGRGQGRGGYTGLTANFSVGTLGVTRFDPPFATVRAPDTGRALQYLYSGISSAIERALPAQEGDGCIADRTRCDGWIQERYDIRDHLGRKVRFGFHYAYTPRQAGLTDQGVATGQAVPTLDNPDGASATPNTHSDDRTGWWIQDVAVVGDVLVGKPIQVRWRAATDGNVHDGHWLLDDIGIFGARYTSNVALLVDETPGRFGAFVNNTTTVPITLRNLGDTVRRELAVEVAIVDQVALNITSSWTGGTARTSTGNLVLRNITLRPGEERVIDLRVGVPPSAGLNDARLLLTLKEQIPTSSSEDPYGRIRDNEVQGFLSALLKFHIQREGSVEFKRAIIPQPAPSLGTSVDLHIPVHNPGFGNVTMKLTCVARTITGYNPVDHVANAPESPIVAAEYPCALKEGDLTLPAKGWTNLTFEATPTHAGFLTFVVNGTVENGTVIPPSRAGIAVGVSSVVWHEPFNSAIDLRNFTGLRWWNYLRGNARAGSLEVGVPENNTLFGNGYYGQFGCNGICRSISPPVDLRNFSEQSPVYLSFWHMDRLAKRDGAQIRASWLRDETRPTASSAWSVPCILQPLDGYEGYVRQKPIPEGGAQTDGDPNTAFDTPPYNRQADRTVTNDPHFFVSEGGAFEESWSLAVIDLSKECVTVEPFGKNFTPARRIVRFEFIAFPGAPAARGIGHAFLVDDIVVSPHAIEVRPDVAQRAHVLDNTTKSFNLLVRNLGTTSDSVRVSFDARNSSMPADSVRVPAAPVTLLPGESKVVSVSVTLPRDPSLLPTDFKARILATSVLDPNAVGATTLDLGFGPRQWAELAVSVSPPVGVVQEGTDTFIPIAIENVGLVESVDTLLRVIDEWDGGTRTIDIPLSPMPSYSQSASEALRVIEFAWRPEKGSVGLHNLTFIVDPEGRGEEYTRTNNHARLTVDVSDLLIPDLHIADFSALTVRNAIGQDAEPAFDADVARYEVTAGELVSFELKISNRGRAGATNVDVRPFLGALSLPGKTVPYIAPGTDVVVTFNWLAQKGEHEVEFLVRTEQVELSTANNRYPSPGVTLLTAKGFEVEVEIPAVEGRLEPGSDVDVAFRVANVGTAGEDLLLVARAPPGMTIRLPREGFFLRPGETYDATARLSLAAEAVAGEQFITIEAIARENSMKSATGRAAVVVKAFHGGNIVPTAVSGSPPELLVPIQIVNEGNSLEPWTVTLTLPAGWQTTQPMPLKLAAPPHDRATFEIPVTISPLTAPGDRVITVNATLPNGEKRSGTVSVAVEALRSAAVSLGAQTPLPERGAINVPIVVANTGNIEAPFSLLLMDTPAGIAMHVEPAQFTLPPGGQAVAALVVKPNATVAAGTYAVTTFASFPGVTLATREGIANLQTIKVPVARQDVRIASVEYTPRADLTAGERVVVKASVHNRGTTGLIDLPVHLFVDDVFAGEVRLATLAAGERRDVSFNWTAIPGVHTLTAVVDPDEGTVDLDRADNGVSVLASVDVDTPSGGIAAGRADTPAPGAFGLIAALAVAVLLTRGLGSRRQRR